MSTSIQITKYPIVNHFSWFRRYKGGYWTQLNRLAFGKYWVKSSYIPCKLFRTCIWEDYT